jgi:hypothetical protein
VALRSPTGRHRSSICPKRPVVPASFGSVGPMNQDECEEIEFKQREASAGGLLGAVLLLFLTLAGIAAGVTWWPAIQVATPLPQASSPNQAK